MTIQLLNEKLQTALGKVADATGTLPAVLIAVIFLAFFGIGNILTGGKLDPNFQLSNWVMNGVGFVMFFVLASISKNSKDHAEAAERHANDARIHAGHARQHAQEINQKLDESSGTRAE